MNNESSHSTKISKHQYQPIGSVEPNESVEHSNETVIGESSHEIIQNRTPSTKHMKLLCLAFYFIFLIGIIVVSQRFFTKDDESLRNKHVSVLDIYNNTIKTDNKTKPNQPLTIPPRPIRKIVSLLIFNSFITEKIKKGKNLTLTLE